jgi:chemotaxis protein CheD
MDNFNLIHVGIADMKISGEQNILRTILGSCIGICLYDRQAKIGGLAHIMLPTMNMPGAPAAKYADTALPLLIKNMAHEGADIKRLKAKIAGGAKMFNLPGNSMIASIGINNANKVEEILFEMGIELLSKDIGGNASRTISFYLTNGDVRIKINGAELIL